MQFYISGMTDIGTTRETNQDSLSVQKLRTAAGNMAFAVLCDGMGGLSHGETASSIVVLTFLSWVRKRLPQILRGPLTEEVIRREWETVISAANRDVYAFGRRMHSMTGSTVTALLLTEERYFLLNIGDSRAYEIFGEITQLTADHTVAEEQIRLGNITREQVREAPLHHQLTKCVGVEEKVIPDLFCGPIRRNAVYMLCSDGFRHRIAPDEIRSGLAMRDREDIPGMREREAKLIEQNKERGETDNISVVTVYADGE